ncbi:MAG: PAS domain-containing protein [Vicinamibacterales bacterium]
MVPEFVQDIPTVWKALTAVGACGAAAYQLGLRVVRPTRAFIDAARTGLAQVEVMAAALGENGGASLADSVRRTEALVQAVAAQQDAYTCADQRPIFRTDGAGGWLHVNHALERCLGWSGDALAGRGWYAAVHEDERHVVVTDWQHAVLDQRRFFRDVRVVNPMGDTRIVRVEAHPMSPRAGAVLGWLGIVTEVGPWQRS